VTQLPDAGITLAAQKTSDAGFIVMVEVKPTALPGVVGAADRALAGLFREHLVIGAVRDSVTPLEAVISVPVGVSFPVLLRLLAMVFGMGLVPSQRGGGRADGAVCLSTVLGDGSFLKLLKRFCLAAFGARLFGRHNPGRGFRMLLSPATRHVGLGADLAPRGKPVFMAGIPVKQIGRLRLGTSRAQFYHIPIPQIIPAMVV